MGAENLNVDWHSSDLRVPTTLPEPDRQELREDLAAADLQPAGLGERLVQFLLEGEGPEVLGELDRENTAARECFSTGESAIRLVGRLDRVDAILLLRLSAVWSILEPPWRDDGNPWLWCCASRTRSARRAAEVVDLAGHDRVAFVRMFAEWSLNEWPAVFEAWPEVLEATWPQLGDSAKADLLRCVDMMGQNRDYWADLVTSEIVNPSAEVREIAGHRFVELDDAPQRFEALLLSSRAQEQIHALELYYRLAPDLPEGLLTRLREKARAKKLVAAIDRTLGEIQECPAFEVPPPPVDLSVGKPTPELRAAFGRSLDEFRERRLAAAKSRYVPDPISEPDRDFLFSALFDPEPWTPGRVVGVKDSADVDHTWAVALGLVPYVRVCLIFFDFDPWDLLEVCTVARPETRDLRVLAEAARYAGFDPAELATEWFQRPREATDSDLSAAWPFFADQLHVLRTPFFASSAEIWVVERRCLALRIIAGMPIVPPALDGLVWEYTLAKGLKERPLARACFDARPGIVDRITAALSDADPRIRRSAAEWLTDRRDPEAAPATRARLEVETDETVRRALTRALFEMEGSVERVAGPAEDLEPWAAGVLAHGFPEELEWLERETLPALVWSSSSESVDRTIVDAWIVNAVAQKDPTTDFGLQPYFDALEPEGRRTFALELFERWFEAAQSEAESRWWKGRGSAEFVAGPSKGLLSLVACGRPDAGSIVKQAEGYVRKYYGCQLHEAQALLRLVSCLDDSAGIQLLVSIAERFRTKALQKEARRLLDVLAERRGWSRDEFSDRTIPHADLDDQRSAKIHFEDAKGQVTRTFTVELSDAFQLTVRPDGGKPVKSLPKPRKEESEDSAKEARAVLTFMRKQVKETVRVQSSRLYEALCLAREWTVDLWNSVFLEHPIMSLLAQRCLWGEFRAGERTTTFRPLDDRTLTDARDQPVRLHSEATVRLIHSLDLSEEKRIAWRNHLADYEISPLLRQVDTEPFRLSPDQRNDTEVKATSDAKIEARKASRELTRLGYARGPAYEGAQVHSASKLFPGLGIQAVIEHSGFPIVGDDEPIQIERLSFVRLDDDPVYPRSRKKLGEIPPILLSECVSDLRSLT